MATNRDLLKEAIADAKAVKETAIANAKAALEEAFTPQLKSMFAAKLQEMEEDEKMDEALGTLNDPDTPTAHGNIAEEDLDEYAEIQPTDLPRGMSGVEKDEDMMEIDLEELLKELEMEEGDMEESLNEAEGDEDDDMKMSDEDSDEGDEEGTPLDLEDMTDEDLKSMIEDVIKDMIASGELEGGEEEMGSEEGVEMKDEEEVDLAELLKEIEEMEDMDEAYGREAEQYEYYSSILGNPDSASKLANVAKKLKDAAMAGELDPAELDAVAMDVNKSLNKGDIKAIEATLKEAYELNEQEAMDQAGEEFIAKANAEIEQLAKTSRVQKLASRLGVGALALGATLFMAGVNSGMADSLTAKFGATVDIPTAAIAGIAGVVGGVVFGLRGAANKYAADEEAKRLKAEIDKKRREMGQGQELEEAYETIKSLKAELNEINLLNAKLLYTNKIFKSKNLNESQKVKVLSSFDKATTVGEVKLVFETLNEGIKVKSNVIKENLGSASKSTITPNVKKPIVESNDAFARMQKLAGII